MIEKPKGQKLYNAIDFLHKHIVGVIVAVVIVACALSTLSFLLGNSRNDDDENDNIQYEDTNTLFFAMHDITTLNPLTSQDEDVYYITQLLYSSLFRLDDTLNVTNDLVSSYTVDTEEGRVTIVLRDGVTFSDGSALTSDDVRSTVSDIKSIGSASPYYNYVSKIYRVSVENSTTFTVIFNDPSDAALDNLVFPIVSTDYTTGSSYDMVGSGQYMYSSYDGTTLLSLVPNPNYYGDVATNNIQFKILPQITAATGLMTTDSIAAYVNEAIDADSDAEDKDLGYTPISSSEAEYLGFNFSNKYLADQNVRHAIALAINVDSIVSDNYGGTAVASDSIYFPGFLGTENAGDAYPLNQSEAVSTLREAGIEDTDEDGILEDADNQEVALTLLVNNNNTSRLDAAGDIAEALENIGFNVTVKSLAWAEYNEALTAGEYDIMLGGYKFDKQYDLRQLFNGQNVLKYNNSDVLSNVNRLETALTAEDAKATYETLKEQITTDLPYYCLCYKTYGFITAKRLTNENVPTFFDRYRGASTWTWQRAVVEDTASDTYEEEDSDN